MSRKHHPTHVPTVEERALIGPDGGAALATRWGVVVARAPQGCGHSSVFELLQGVWEAFPGRAHAMLRGRIFSAEPATGLDLAAVRLAGKRLTAGMAPSPASPAGALDVGPWARRARARARRAALTLGDLGPPDGWTTRIAEVARTLPVAPRRSAVRDRLVVAALMSPTGEVLEAARNTAGHNRTLHAEVNLVQRWVRRTRARLPTGAVVVTSLQPCRMCAAMLAQAADGHLSVWYAQADPGRFARGTALQRGGSISEREVPPIATGAEEGVDEGRPT